MIEIRIDTASATPAEAAMLEKLPGYQELVAHLVRHGRQIGVSLVIKRPLSDRSHMWLYNTPQGNLQMLVGAGDEGKSSFAPLDDAPAASDDGHGSTASAKGSS